MLSIFVGVLSCKRKCGNVAYFQRKRRVVRGSVFNRSFVLNHDDAYKTLFVRIKSYFFTEGKMINNVFLLNRKRRGFNVFEFCNGIVNELEWRHINAHNCTSL